MARFIVKRIGDNMFFESTLTIPLKTPELPEFLHKFNIEIKTPSILDLTASYKPITKEIVLFDHYKQIAKGLINNYHTTHTKKSNKRIHQLHLFRSKPFISMVRRTRQ